MSIKNILSRLWLLLPAFLLALPACNFPTPRCTAEQLQVPGNLHPHEEFVASDGSLILSGTYPATTCNPDYIEAYVWRGVEPTTPGMTARIPFSSVNSSGNWHMPWPTVLQPGTNYFWRAYAGLETGPGPDVDGPNTFSYFYTEPECAYGAAMEPVDLINPPDNTTIDPNADLTFAWDDPATCMVDGGYEIQISLQANFSDYLHRIPIRHTAYTVPNWEFDPDFQNCTRYYWRIKTDPTGPQEGPYTEAWSFFTQTPGIFCPITHLPGPLVVARQTLNCRGGPSPLYDTKDTFNQGESAPIQGRNQDGTWWQIISPHLQIPCWVWGEQTDVQGDTSDVPLIAVAPPVILPTPTDTVPPQHRVDCAQYKDPQTCSANSACYWYKPVVGGAGSCKNK